MAKRQQVNTNLPSDQLQTTAQQVQLNLQGSKPSRSAKFLKELQGVSSGVGNAIASIQAISQQNTQRELAAIATEKRVSGEARQELASRLSVKKQQIAQEKAEAKRIKSAQDKIDKEAAKAAKEAQSVANEQAEVKLILSANGGKDLSETGSSVRQKLEIGDRDGAQGLSDISISVARKRAKQQIDAERKQLTPDQINSYNIEARYDELFNSNLESMGFDIDTVIASASPDSVSKALNDKFESEEDLINDKIDIRKQQMIDAGDAMIGAHSVNMQGEILLGRDNPLGNFVNKISNPSNTSNIDYTLDEVRDSTIDSIGTYAQSLIDDPSIDGKQGQALIDSLIGKTRADKDSIGASIVNTDEFKKSVSSIKKRINTAKATTSLKTSVNQASSLNELRNQNTPEETIAFASNTYGASPGVDGRYTINQLPLMSVDGEQITPSMLKSINAVTQKAIDDTNDQAKVDTGIVNALKTGSPIDDSYRGVPVTDSAIRKTINTMVVGPDGEISPSRVVSTYLTGSLGDKPFTPEIKKAYSVDMSSGETMINSYNKIIELENLGGKELVKWKLDSKTSQFKTDLDVLLFNNPLAMNDETALASVRDQLLMDKDKSVEAERQRKAFFNSKDIKDNVIKALNENVVEEGFASFFVGDFDVEYNEVVNKQLIDSLAEKASNLYFNLNRGNPDGFDDYFVEYLNNNTFVDADTKEMSVLPKNGNFKSSKSMTKALSSAGDYVLNQGVSITPEVRAAANKVSGETKFITSNLVPGRLTASFKKKGIWVPMIDENNRPISIHVDDLSDVAIQAEKNKVRIEKEKVIEQERKSKEFIDKLPPIK